MHNVSNLIIIAAGLTSLYFWIKILILDTKLIISDF
jgi:hypothetical protein